MKTIFAFWKIIRLIVHYVPCNFISKLISFKKKKKKRKKKKEQEPQLIKSRKVNTALTTRTRTRGIHRINHACWFEDIRESGGTEPWQRSVRVVRAWKSDEGRDEIHRMPHVTHRCEQAFNIRGPAASLLDLWFNARPSGEYARKEIQEIYYQSNRHSL